MKKTFWVPLLVIIMLSSCKKEEATLTKDRISIQLQHQVDGQALIFDSLLYINNAGEKFGIEKLQYYLSNFRFYEKGALLTTIDTIIYVDARTGNLFTFNNTLFHAIDSVGCNIGLDSLHNIHGILPATPANISMEWPDVMGGGYHFIKLEGHWKDGSQTSGFAIHLGTNPFLVAAGKLVNFSLRPGNNELKITMNVAEWLKHPHSYSFNNDGVYTMGDTVLMRKLKENGSDVLKFENQN
jgi:hypothetical protein